MCMCVGLCNSEEDIAFLQTTLTSLTTLWLWNLNAGMNIAELAFSYPI